MPYVIKVPLVIARIDKAVAGEQIESPLSVSSTPTETAQGSYVELLAGSHAATNSGIEAFDALRYYCISPVAADGTAPQFEFWPGVDGVQLRNYQDIDGSLETNMAPWPENTQGGPYDANGEFVGGLEIGKSLWSLTKYDPLAAVSPVGKNVASKATGLKAADKLQIVGLSSDGWDYTTGGVYDPTKGTAAIVMIWGEIWTKSLTDVMAARWNNQIALQMLDRQVSDQPALIATTGIDTISLVNWDELPGGVNQNGTKVNRVIRWSYNAIATTASERFSLTQNNSPLHGTSSNVPNNRDLGFPLNTKAKSDNAFWLQQLGVHITPGSSAPNYCYVQVVQDGTQIPDDQDFKSGLRIDRYRNLLNYGNAQPMISTPNRYDTVPHWLAKTLVYQNNTVIAIQDNGTSIPAKGVYVAVAGPYFEAIK